MKRFEIIYKPNENVEKTIAIGTVANNETKALKAFALKVPYIPSRQIISVNGQPLQESWLSAYPTYDGIAQNVDRTSTKREYGADPNLPERSSHQQTNSTQQDSAPTLGIVGILLILIGLFLLVINPGSSVGVEYIVNIQKVIIGQTLTITGAIFVAAQWRPL